MAEEQEKQIKSKERVRERGEVFTAAREVNAMLDLVKDETENIDSTFLEPACGDGNFLDEVLRRKLAVCQKCFGKSAEEYEKKSFLACASLYGVDIMPDNVTRCRERLFDTWERSFKPRQKSDFHDRVARAVRKVFALNIQLGNALSMKLVDENQRDLDDPIMFVEWKPAMGDKINRRAFRFDVLLEVGSQKQKQADTFGNVNEDVTEMLFSFDEENTKSDAAAAVNWMVDPDDQEKKRMIPAPSKVYPLIDYWRIGDE